MLVFSKARLVFLSVPKTGSTAYEHALAPYASMIISHPPALKHTPIYRYNRFFRPMLEKFVNTDMDLLAVMREPVSWLGSWYRYRQRPQLSGLANATHGVSFDGFVRAYCRRQRPDFANVGSQARFLRPTPDGTTVRYLFRYEDQAGLTRFLENRLNVAVKTRQMNVSSGVAPALSRSVEHQLREVAADDFLLWNSIEPNGSYHQTASQTS